MNKKIKVMLELDAIAVGKIEAAAEGDIQSLLEDEINNNPDAFIELMGYDNNWPLFKVPIYYWYDENKNH